MSAIRDVRLLIARHLNLEPNVNAAVLDVLNILDASLDAEGYEPPKELVDALTKLDYVIVYGEVPANLDDDDDEEEDYFDDSDVEFDDDDDDDDDED